MLISGEPLYNRNVTAESSPVLKRDRMLSEYI